MKTYINNMFRLGMLLLMMGLAMSSCQETWDDHYGATSTITYEGTVEEALDNYGCADFAEIVEAVGYGELLNNNQMLTIWAPKMTPAEKEKLLQLIETRGRDYVAKNFIKNHVALSTYSMKSESQTIPMMNSKLLEMAVVGNDSVIGNAKITESNIICANGVLHIIDQPLIYTPNIYELLEDDFSDYVAGRGLTGTNHLDTIIAQFAYIMKYDDDELDVNKSTPGGLNEYGEQEYIDSVMDRYNIVLAAAEARIYEEDSNYVAIVPSDKAYRERYAIAKSLLNFNGALNENVDSLTNYYSHYFATRDLYFNANLNEFDWENKTVKGDSLISTQYYSSDWPYGIYKEMFANENLGSVEAIPCSNGVVYKMDNYPDSINVEKQFFREISMDSRYLSAYLYDNSDNPSRPLTKDGENPTRQSISIVTTNVSDGSIVGNRQIESLVVRPSNSTTGNPSVAFKIPRTLAGTYNIKLVLSPAWMRIGFSGTEQDSIMGYKFRAKVYERDDTPESLGKYNHSSNTALKPGGQQNIVLDVLAKDNPKYYLNGKYVMTQDTIALGEHTFKHSYCGGTTYDGAILQIESYVRTTSDRKKYSRTLLINELILEPVVDK